MPEGVSDERRTHAHVGLFPVHWTSPSRRIIAAMGINIIVGAVQRNVVTAPWHGSQCFHVWSIDGLSKPNLANDVDMHF